METTILRFGVTWVGRALVWSQCEMEPLVGPSFGGCFCACLCGSASARCWFVVEGISWSVDRGPVIGPRALVWPITSEALRWISISGIGSVQCRRFSHFFVRARPNVIVFAFMHKETLDVAVAAARFMCHSERIPRQGRALTSVKKLCKCDCFVAGHVGKSVCQTNVLRRVTKHGPLVQKLQLQ